MKWTSPRRWAMACCHLLATLSLTSCSTITVSSDYALEQDFSGYRQYAWHPDGIDKSASLEAMGGDIFERRVRRLIEAKLQALGMRQNEEADFYINYSVVTDERVSIDSYHTYGGYGPGWGYYGYAPYYGGLGATQTAVYYYTQGTLIIDIIDGKSDQLVWRATADGRVETQSTPEKREQYLGDIIDRMLGEFPPPKPKA
jgi:hypothetical protein